ncbi:MAG: phosphoesterase, partial [Aureliella sp.]
MPSFIDVIFAQHQFRLLADRGLYWPKAETLFIADTHFGKEATFRALGVPVPVGSTAGTLGKIVKMLRDNNARRLCILGDMFHA